MRWLVMTEDGPLFELVEHRGAESGPVVCLLAAIHGDEEEGVLALQRISASLAVRPPERGTVRIVAICHRAAYDADTRRSPVDGLDLARTFPGRADGSPTEVLAHDLTERAIRGSDLLVDLHSAGRLKEMPLFVGYVDDGDCAVGSRAAAAAFGAPLVWEHLPPVPAGRTVSIAQELGIPSIYAEAGGGGELRANEVDAYEAGVLAVLASLGIIATAAELPPAPREVVRDHRGDLDAGLTAPCGGRFVRYRQGGDLVAVGDLLGEVVAADGSRAASIEAPFDGTVMLIRRAARVDAGDVVCALGAPKESWSA
jgi:predicted deacylase